MRKTKYIHAFPTNGDAGMSLRDYFAAKAMQAFVVSDEEFDPGGGFSNVAEKAYQVADAMLRERHHMEADD